MMFMKLTKIMITNKIPKVYLIRHGATDLNGEGGASEDRIRGWLDVPLNSEGKQDALKAQKELKDEDPKVIYCSDLTRTKQTAQIINKAHNASIKTDKNLRPWNVGDFSGKPTKDVIDQMNQMVRDESLIPPNGESFKVFRIRYLSEMKKIINQAIKEKSTIFVVAHLRNLKTYEAWEQNGFPSDFSIKPDVMIKDKDKPGSIKQLDIKKYMEKNS